MKVRTIRQAVKEIHARDSDSAITEYRLRQLVLAGEIPSRKAGNRFLILLEDVAKYFGVEL